MKESEIFTYQIGYVSFNCSFNLTIVNLFKTRDDVYICDVRKLSLLNRKLNIADFQCQKRKYTLNVNISNCEVI